MSQENEKIITTSSYSIWFSYVIHPHYLVKDNHTVWKFLNFPTIKIFYMKSIYANIKNRLCDNTIGFSES